MKKLLIKIIIITAWLLPEISLSQSNDQELHDRYWSYRDRFRKYFTSIGKEPGQGFPFSDIELSNSAWAHCTSSN